jgi:hypothetical protein
MSEKLTLEVEAFTPRRSNTLFGFATVYIPALQLRIFDLSVHEKNGKRWCGLPAKPWVDRDGIAKRGDDGKIIYAPVLEFADQATRHAFSDRVIAALLIKFPRLFDDQTAEAAR